LALISASVCVSESPGSVPAFQISGTFQSPAPAATGHEIIPLFKPSRAAAVHKVSVWMSRANQCQRLSCGAGGGSKTLLP
jgi:hypothetical protein